MADTETTADIIAWLRRPREGENAYLTLWRYEIADRLEAAHKRERGDAAKLREALRECAQYIVCVAGVGVGEVTINDNVRLIPEELTQKAVAALAAPPRNCDVGTAQEQAVRYDRYCSSHGHNATCSDATHICADCPLLDQKTECEFVWAQMPYEEGGAK